MIDKYSIKDLEVISGIKAHTLRIWEQRYQLLSPNRTETNIRWYSNEELKHLLNVCLLYNHGFKISKIASLPKEKINEEVNSLINSKASPIDQIDFLIMSMVEFKEELFNKVVDNYTNKYGLEKTLEEIIFPFLTKVGYMWQTGTICPAQEHFVSYLIRQKIIAAIASKSIPSNPNLPKVVLFLPDMEIHELKLLFINYFLKIRGYKVFYLGQAVPTEDLIKINEVIKPDFFLSVFTQSFKEGSIDEYVNEILEKVNDGILILTGYQIANYKGSLPERVKTFQTSEELLALMSK